MSTGRAVLLIIIVGTLVRLALAAATGLGTDEAYMAGNARELALGYFDHPPLHVWIAWAAERLFASEAPIFVRLPFIAFFAGSTWLMFRLTAQLFGSRAGLWAAMAFNLAPVFSFADGSWVLPDGPAIFFLLAAAIAVARVLFEAPTRQGGVGWWLAAGVLAGLALLSKFNAAFFPLAVFVYLLTVPSARRHLATSGPWLALLAAVVVVSPAIVWNVEHGWVGVAFQAGRAEGSRIELASFATEIGGELAYLTPWLAVPFALSLARGAGARPARPARLADGACGDRADRRLHRDHPVVARPAALDDAGLLFAIPLFGRDAALLAERRPRFARGYMAVAALLFAALLVAFTVQATQGGLIRRRS